MNGHPHPSTLHRSRLLIEVIPWVSLVSLVLFQLTIWGGIVAAARLRRYLASSDDPRVRILDVGRAPRILGVTGPALIPLMLPVTWILLLTDDVPLLVERDGDDGQPRLRRRAARRRYPVQASNRPTRRRRSARYSLGERAVVSRLVDLIFVQALRRWFERRPPGIAWPLPLAVTMASAAAR